MEILLAILTGFLFSIGVYLMLRRSIIKFILGVIFMSNATNLLVFLSAGIVPGVPVFIGESAVPEPLKTDPLPQALVLTAIVIGFGLVVFTLALKYKFFSVTGTDDLDQLKKTDG